MLKNFAPREIRAVMGHEMGHYVLNHVWKGTAAGIPLILVLFFAVVQLPAILILGPIIVYVFATASTGMAVVFTVWSLVVSFSDNFLKPLLLGRGVQIPTLVIFMGAIGGFLLQGIIGLFVGAVVLAVGYTLLNDWLSQAP